VRPEAAKRWIEALIPYLTLGNRVAPGGVMNVMLLFVPLAVMGRLFDLGAVFTFVCAALSCVPLSYRLGQATEEVGSRLGPVSGGLLNATFGNAAELIISIAALNHGLLILVRMTIIGSILGQLLLVLGTSLLLAGLRYRELGFSRALVQTNFTLIVIAMLVIGLPSVLVAMAPEKAEASASLLTPALCILLLLIYGFTVVFTLRRQTMDEDEEAPKWPLSKGLLLLGASTGGIVLVSELLVSSVLPFVEATNISEVFIGLIVIPIFGNVVDHIVAISVAMKNKMDMSITISVGSASQVACLVLPVVVLSSILMGRPLGLLFAPVELLALGMGLLLMIPVLLDGISNWLEGAQLLTCYGILALVLFAL
jgi:Ca2+:H+ antiporter